MRFYWDLDVGGIVQRQGTTSLLTRVNNIVRSPAEAVEIVFLRAGEPVELDGSAPEVGFVIKAEDQYDTSGLALLDNFSFDDTAIVYTGTVDLTTTELNALFFIDGSPSNDVVEVQVMAGFGYRPDAVADWKSSNRIEVYLQNNVWRGDELTPTPTPTPLQSWMPQPRLAYTGGGSALDGIETTSLAVGLCHPVVVLSVFSMWQLQAGTAAENISEGVIRPDDYADTTNEKIWVQIQ